MADDPDALTNVFGGLKLLNEPLHFTVGIVLSSMTVQVKVHGIAKVGVERDDAKSRGGAEGVGSIVLERLDSVTSEPSSPVIRQGVVQPSNVPSGLGSREHAIKMSKRTTRHFGQWPDCLNSSHRVSKMG